MASDKKIFTLTNAIQDKDYCLAEQKLAQIEGDINRRNRALHKITLISGIIFAIFLILTIEVFYCRYSLDYVVHPELFDGMKWLPYFLVCLLCTLVLPILAAFIITRAEKKKDLESSVNDDFSKIDHEKDRAKYISDRLDAIPKMFSDNSYKVKLPLAATFVGIIFSIIVLGISTFEEIVGMAFFEAVIMIPCFIVLNVILKLFYNSICSPKSVNAEIEGAKNQITLAINAMQYAEKKSREEERKKEEQEAEKEFEKLMEADKVDEAAVLRLANKGLPSACMYMGQKYSADFLESDEKSAPERLRICRLALQYLEVAKKARIKGADIRCKYLSEQEERLKIESLDENALFKQADADIVRGQEYAAAGKSMAAVDCYRDAIRSVEKLMLIDKAHYQKQLYALYDEIGIIYYNNEMYSRAVDSFKKALENCRECARRDPNGNASRDVEYISSRLHTASSAR